MSLPTVREARLWGRQTLLEGGDDVTDTPALDADVLLRHVLGCDQIGLILAHQDPVPPARWRRYRAYILRRMQAEPVAYLTGHREFAGLTLRVDERVLIPRPDTETLVECALVFLRTLGRRTEVVDLGTGSGAVAIAIACRSTDLYLGAPGSHVYAIDIDAGACAVARANVRRLAPPQSITVRQQDGLGRFRHRIDLICANLPYIPVGELTSLPPTVRNWEPHVALFSGHDGLDHYRHLISDAHPHLVTGTRLMMECDPRQATALGMIARASDPRVLVTTHVDLSHRPRVVEVFHPVNPPTDS